MGKRGPAKEPLAIKMARGTDRASDRCAVAISMPSGVPQKPPWLALVGDEASSMWDQAVGLLSQTPGLLSEPDGPALATYCVAWQRLHDAQREIEKHGITAISEKGGVYQHPAVGIQNKAIETINRIGSKFAMTPSDRSSMKLEPNKTSGVRRRKKPG